MVLGTQGRQTAQGLRCDMTVQQAAYVHMRLLRTGRVRHAPFTGRACSVRGRPLVLLGDLIKMSLCLAASRFPLPVRDAGC